MRLIDANALEKEGWSLHRTIRVDKYTSEYQTKSLKQILTIETESKKGRWIDDGSELGCVCSECGASLDDYISNLNEYNHLIKYPRFCPNCGSDNSGGKA